MTLRFPTLADVIATLQVDQLEADRFAATQLDNPAHHIVGGHLAGQALMAASRTAPDRAPHSVHVYYLRAGDARRPVEFEVFELGDPPSDVVAMSEEELTAEMGALIRTAPRTWKEILQHFIGQPYRTVYGAFSNLRDQLGRCDDEPWYRYAFSGSDFAQSVQEGPPANFDPRHRG